MGHDKTASEAAEMLALRTILTNVLLQIGKLDPHLQYAIRQGFNNAAESILRSPKPSRWDDGFEAVRLVEEMRADILGDEGPSLAPVNTE